jgi:hypothetical protein
LAGQGRLADVAALGGAAEMRGVGQRHQIAELLQRGHGLSILSIRKTIKIDWHDEQGFAI